MIDSAVAVIAGFFVMALLVMATNALAVRFALRAPASVMRTPGPEVLTPAYLATHLIASGIAALIGGFTTAVIANHDRLAHGLALAALMVVISVVSMRQPASGQPRWYRVVLAAVMAALAVAGAALSNAVISR